MVFVSGLPTVSMVFAENAEDKSYVIWDANPIKIVDAEGNPAPDGTSAKPAWASTVDGWQFANNTTGTGAVRTVP